MTSKLETNPDSGAVVFTFAVRFADLGLDSEALEQGTQSLRCGLFRATRKDDVGEKMAWASWIDPNDNVVDFHRPETFGVVSFVGNAE